jgi:FlaA1/EpsC-like NDP-sugar epimerase
MIFQNKRVLVTGGTGSLGQVLVRRLLSGKDGLPAKIIVFSRDEAKQHFMRLQYQQKAPIANEASSNGFHKSQESRPHMVATDEVIYNNFRQRLEFRIGDVRDYHSLAGALHDVDIVFNAAALKQVPTCEYFPYEAVRTNIEGPENIIRAIQSQRLPVEIVIGISTDKACKPVNAMGMTKALQERIFIQANMRCNQTRFICARYGNVLASRGSVIPLFHEQIISGGPVTITSPDMTRFLLSLDDAVDTIFAAVREGQAGETYIPRVPSALVTHIAQALIGSRKISIKIVGIRPGEKIHEILVSEEEAHRTIARGAYYVIRPMLPELCSDNSGDGSVVTEYSSGDSVMSAQETERMLQDRRLTVEDIAQEHQEVLR